MLFRWGPFAVPDVTLCPSSGVPVAFRRCTSAFPVVFPQAYQWSPSAPPKMPLLPFQQSLSLFRCPWYPSSLSNGVPLTLSAVPHQSSGAPSTYPMTLAPPNVTLRLMVALQPSQWCPSDLSKALGPCDGANSALSTSPRPFVVTFLPFQWRSFTPSNTLRPCH